MAYRINDKNKMGAAEGLKLKEAEAAIANGKTLKEVLEELKKQNDCRKEECKPIDDADKMGAAEGLKLKEAEVALENGKTLKEVLAELRKDREAKEQKYGADILIAEALADLAKAKQAEADIKAKYAALDPNSPEAKKLAKKIPSAEQVVLSAEGGVELAREIGNSVVQTHNEKKPIGRTDQTTKEDPDEVKPTAKKTEKISLENQLETARETSKQTGLLEKIEKNTKACCSAKLDKKNDASWLDTLAKGLDGLKVVAALTAVGTAAYGLYKVFNKIKEWLGGDSDEWANNLDDIATNIANAVREGIALATNTAKDMATAAANATVDAATAAKHLAKRTASKVAYEAKEVAQRASEDTADAASEAIWGNPKETAAKVKTTQEALAKAQTEAIEKAKLAEEKRAVAKAMGQFDPNLVKAGKAAQQAEAERDIADNTLKAATGDYANAMEKDAKAKIGQQRKADRALERTRRTRDRAKEEAAEEKAEADEAAATKAEREKAEAATIQERQETALKVEEAILVEKRKKEAERAEAKAARPTAEANGATGGVGMFGGGIDMFNNLVGGAAAAGTATRNAVGSISGGFGDRAAALMKDLMNDYRLTKAQAAGIVGNLAHESNGLQAGIEGTSGDHALGWAQWTGPRRKAFEDYAAKNNMAVTDPAANYGFMKHELATTHKDAISKVKATSTVAESTRAWHDSYEKSGDVDLKSGTIVKPKHYASREKYANQAAGMDLGGGNNASGILGEASNYLGMNESNGLDRITSLTDIKDPVNVPWCAAFVSGVLKRKGYKPSKSPNNARSYLTYGKHVDITQAQEGDIAVFNRKGGGHVGFYVSHSGDSIKILGGNQKDSVSYSTRSITEKGNELLGIRRPTEADKISGGSAIDNATNAVTDPNSRTNAGADTGGALGRKGMGALGAGFDSLFGTSGGADAAAAVGEAVGKIFGGGMGMPIDIMTSIMKDIPLKRMPLEGGPYSPGTMVPTHINSGRGKFGKSITDAMSLIGASNRNADLASNKASKPITITNPFLDNSTTGVTTPTGIPYPTRNTDPTLMKYLDMLIGATK